MNIEPMMLKKFLGESRTIQATSNISEEFIVTGISTDTRSLQKGEVFIALQGEHFDGHDFLKTAIERGAAALVISQAHRLTAGMDTLPILRVTDTLAFLMEYASWYRSQFSVQIIALTGSTGKTTCKEILASVLSRKYRIIKTPLNLNNFIGVSLSLLQLQKNVEVGIIEMGTNHPGEIATLTGMVRPTQAAITNIGSGHIGFFGSRQAIFQEKKTLLDGVTSGGKIYLNLEDEFLKNYKRPDVAIITYGLRENCTYQATLVRIDQWGHVYFSINHGPEIRVSLLGRHQLLNALLAGSVGMELGVPVTEIKEALETAISTDKRMEVQNRQGVTIINDAYNANPESLRAAIDFLESYSVTKNSRKFLVVGDMLELGEFSTDEHRRIGHYLQDKKIDFVFCLGPFSRLIVEELQKEKNHSIHSEIFTSHQDLARELNQRVRENDIVLIKGSRGMSMEKVLDYLDIKETVC